MSSGHAKAAGSQATLLMQDLKPQKNILRSRFHSALFLFFSFLVAGSPQVTQAGLKCVIVLPQVPEGPEWWSYGPCSVLVPFSKDFFLDKGSFHSLGCPGIHYVAQAGLQLAYTDPLALAS